MTKHFTTLNCEQLEDRALPSVSIQFNYSLDTNGFFSDTARRDLLTRAALLLTSKLNDTLSAITPSGTNTWTPEITHPATGARKTLTRNMQIPADKIIVYAGGRNLDGFAGIGGPGAFAANGSTSWLNTVRGRGEAGALLADPTDTAPAVGSITFDTNPSSPWHFGKSTNGLSNNEIDFLSIAVHELGHVLGIGTAASWYELVSGGRFTGARTRQVHGSNVLLDLDDEGKYSHFAENTQTPEGTEAAMDPNLLNGTRKFFGDIDFAALDDIGWEPRGSDDSLYRAQDTLSIDSPGLGSRGFAGAIGTSTDVDFYRVFAVQGASLFVAISAAPTGTRIDTFVRVYDFAGTVLATGDQGAVGGRDSITLTVPRTDYYFIAVSSFANRTYNPFSINSGPGGPLGTYQVDLELELD